MVGARIFQQLNMSGVIRTYQKPPCGGRYPSSKGGAPIVCDLGCGHTPTKFYIRIYYKKKKFDLYRDKAGHTFHFFEHADETLTEIRAALRRNAFDPADYSERALTFERFFTDNYQPGYPTGSTRDKLKSINEHHFAPLHPVNIKEIKGLDIKEWWLDLREKGRAPKYCNDILDWLKRVFSEAYNLQIIERMPTFPKPLKVSKKKIDWLTEDEQWSVYSQIPDKDKPIYFFLFLTGVRVMEAAALHWEDIDWNERIITIQRTIDSHGKLGPPKDRGVREIPLGNSVHEMLTELRSIQDPTPIAGPVFKFQSSRYKKTSRRDNRTYSYEYIRSTWVKACRDAGVREIQLKNATRHSWGNQRRRAGIALSDVSEGLGHASVEMTKNYVGPDVENIRKLYK